MVDFYAHQKSNLNSMVSVVCFSGVFSKFAVGFHLLQICRRRPRTLIALAAELKHRNANLLSDWTSINIARLPAPVNENYSFEIIYTPRMPVSPAA